MLNIFRKAILLDLKGYNLENINAALDVLDFEFKRILIDEKRDALQKTGRDSTD